jgi:biopolymer transport protein ExbB
MKRLFGALILACCSTITLAAPSMESSRSLGRLLDAVKQGRLQDAEEAAAREERFIKETESRKVALAGAKREQAQHAERAALLERRYVLNARKLDQQRAQLHERLVTLGDIFAHLRAAGEPLRDTFRASLTAAQFGNERVEKLNALLASTANSEALPAIEELESLWYEMQRELTASGEVARFDAEVYDLSGAASKASVLRVGLFNVVHGDGRYLQYLAARGALAELPKQPAWSYTNAGAALAAARAGLHDFGVDPSGPRGGDFLTTLLERPDAWQRIARSGWLGASIAALGIAGLVIAIGWFLPHAALRRARIEPVHAQILLEHGPRALQIIALLAALAGLLGSAWGLLQSASAVATFGVEDPRRLAGMLAADLATLVLGLSVALVLLMARIVPEPAERYLPSESG